MFSFVRRFTVTLAATLALSASWGGAAHSATDDTDTEDTITWMVRPSDGVSEDGRSWVEQEVDPGESVEEHMIVRNLSSSAVTFQLGAADGYFTDTGRFNMLTSDEESTDAGTWIEIQDTVEVAPGGEAIVPFTLTVPENATPGDHPAGVAAAIRSGEDEQIGVESRVGFRVMTRVTGELISAVQGDVAGTYEGSWNPFEAGRLDVEYTIVNSGNTRLAVSPQITATALFGLVTYTIPGEEIVEIAPGESRTGTVSFAQALPLVAFTADVTASATTLESGEGGAEVEKASGNVIIIAMPWPQLITVLLSALLVWWLWRDRRKRERKFEVLLEHARQEGPRPTESTPVLRNSAVLRPARIGLAVCVPILAAGLAFWGAAPAHASADTVDDTSSLRLHVEITAPPVIAPTPTPSALSGTLPATGASDVSALAWGGVALATLGAVVAFSGRRTSRR